MGSDDTDDLWKAVNDLRAAVADLSGLVREVRAMLNERCDVRAKAISDIDGRVTKATADHEARLRIVEHKIWWVSGGTAVALFVLEFFFRR